MGDGKHGRFRITPLKGIYHVEREMNKQKRNGPSATTFSKVEMILCNQPRKEKKTFIQKKPEGPRIKIW